MLSGFLAKSYVSASLAGLVLASGEPRFYPSGCGGHKNLENAATFSKFLGREEKPRLRAPLGDVFALPVQLRPPEMGSAVVIGAFYRDWEGGFVSGGRKWCTRGRGCLEMCLKAAGAGVVLCRGVGFGR